MEILEIKDIEREESHIYYRRTYHGTAIISTPRHDISVKVQFTIEVDPLGQRSVELNFLETIAYPLLPLQKALIEFIIELDKKDKLLC